MGFIVATGLNLLIAQWLSHGHGYRVYNDYIEFPPLSRFGIAFRWLIWAGVLLIGYMVSQWVMSHWLEYLLAKHQQTIGQVDPLFGIDFGFYLFRLPFNWFLYYLALIAVIVCLLSTVFLYLVDGGVWVTPRGPKVMGVARAHLMVLGALLFVVFAYRVRLAMYGLLYSPRGLIYGAGYADVHATLPILKAELFLCSADGSCFCGGGEAGTCEAGALFRRRFWWPSRCSADRFIRRSSSASLWRPMKSTGSVHYIANAIKFTRQAYALDRFEEREFSAVEDLSAG